MSAKIVKGEIWTLFGDKALDFATWLNGTGTNSIAVQTIFSSLVEIDLESAIFDQIVQILLTEAVITSTQTDAIAAKVAQLNALPSFGS